MQRTSAASAKATAAAIVVEVAACAHVVNTGIWMDSEGQLKPPYGKGDTLAGIFCSSILIWGIVVALIHVV